MAKADARGATTPLVGSWGRLGVEVGVELDVEAVAIVLVGLIGVIAVGKVIAGKSLGLVSGLGGAFGLEER